MRAEPNITMVVADAFILELHERMQVFSQNANGPGGGAVQELRILMWSFGCVLGLELDGPGTFDLSERRTTIMRIAELDSNV